MSIIHGIPSLPNVPNRGTLIVPLMNANDIFQTQQQVIDATEPSEALYICHYSLPQVREISSAGTPASDAQRQILEQIRHGIIQKQIRAYIIADNSNEKMEKGRNEETLRYLHLQGAFALPYPKSLVSINHSKILGNKKYIVVSSANLSSHSADSPDDNTGFLLAGDAAKNGIMHSFYPQWRVSTQEDMTEWSKHYPPLQFDFDRREDPTVTWLNTAPPDETHDNFGSLEILEEYQSLVFQALHAPTNAYLYFEQFDLSHLGFVKIILLAHHENPTLDIRFILDPNQYLEGIKAGPYDTRVVAYHEVTASGIPIRFARVKPHPNDSQDPQWFHDKFVVYNDEVVINGSGNLSNHSLGNFSTPYRPHPKKHNREVDVKIRDEIAAKAFKEKFLIDWETRTVLDPKIASRSTV